jgi:hypothetical protein
VNLGALVLLLDFGRLVHFLRRFVVGAVGRGSEVSLVTVEVSSDAVVDSKVVVSSVADVVSS